MTMEALGMTDCDFRAAERFFDEVVGRRRFDEWCGVTGEEAETAEDCDDGNE